MELQQDELPINPIARSPPGPLTIRTFGSSSGRALSGHLLPDEKQSRRLVPTIQQLRPARPSMEVEEDVSASPPTFRQPLLVGSTPSPRADSFNVAGDTSSLGLVY